MKYKKQTLLVLFFLLFLWGTWLMAPFRYFAGISADAAQRIIERLNFSDSVQALGVLLFLYICLGGMIWMRVNKKESYLVALCILVSSVFYYIASGPVATVPVQHFAGILLAMAVYAFDLKRLYRWATDFYLLSIPVLIIYEAFFTPLFRAFRLRSDLLEPWIRISSQTPLGSVTFFGLPTLFWGIAITIVTVAGVAYFFPASPGIRKRKQQQQT